MIQEENVELKEYTYKTCLQNSEGEKKKEKNLFVVNQDCIQLFSHLAWK